MALELVAVDGVLEIKNDWATVHIEAGVNQHRVLLQHDVDDVFRILLAVDLWTGCDQSIMRHERRAWIIPVFRICFKSHDHELFRQDNLVSVWEAFQIRCFFHHWRKRHDRIAAIELVDGVSHH